MLTLMIAVGWVLITILYLGHDGIVLSKVMQGLLKPPTLNPSIRSSRCFGQTLGRHMTAS